MLVFGLQRYKPRMDIVLAEESLSDARPRKDNDEASYLMRQF